MPILEKDTFEFISRSPEQTQRIGIRLGRYLQAEDVICLTGELGAGKTTLVKGIARGWGTSEAVTSPTFVLINQYGRPDGSSLYHLDAYRLNSSAEAEDLDLEQLISEGPLIVEWPERISGSLPSDRLWIEMSWVADERRQLIFKPRGSRYNKILTMLMDNMIKSLP